MSRHQLVVPCVDYPTQVMCSCGFAPMDLPGVDMECSVRSHIDSMKLFEWMWWYQSVPPRYLVGGGEMSDTCSKCGAVIPEGEAEFELDGGRIGLPHHSTCPDEALLSEDCGSQSSLTTQAVNNCDCHERLLPGLHCSNCDVSATKGVDKTISDATEAYFKERERDGADLGGTGLYGDELAPRVIAALKAEGYEIVHPLDEYRGQ